MKLLRYIIPIVLLTGSLLSSCDKLDAPYAVVKNEFDSVNKPFILLEEYTGHKCNNCPLATQKAHQMREFYKQKIILMSIHAGELADPDPKYPQDLKTAVGTELYTNFTVPFVPQGVINRTMYNGKYPLSSEQWPQASDAQFNKPIVNFLSVTASFNATTKNITVTGNTWFKSVLPSGAKIVYYIVEDSIKGPQLNKDTAAGPTPVIDPYYFMHTLRASMNGTYGDVLTSSIEINKSYDFSKTYKVSDTTWNTRQLSLITVILDPSATQYGTVVGVNDTKIKVAK